MNNHQLVERYVRAHTEQDWASVVEMTAPDVLVSYPQSGEVIKGRDDYVAMLSNYPGRLDESELAVTRLHVPKESVHVIASPIALPMITVIGAGDDFFFEGLVRYPDGSDFNIVGLIELGAGRVVKETWYFAAPFDAPAWRAPYVEGSTGEGRPAS
jgi:hypothetical protein